MRPDVEVLEPEIRAAGALLSPSTGIVDSHGLMLALLGNAETEGVMLALHSPVERAAVVDKGDRTRSRWCRIHGT